MEAQKVTPSTFCGQQYPVHASFLPQVNFHQVPLLLTQTFAALQTVVKFLEANFTLHTLTHTQTQAHAH